ncbi:MAG: hypothetical protein WDM89_07440 [Rhizomicrobium sp.]
MLKTKNALLMGACALSIGMTGLADTASAKGTNTSVYGGGSSLISVYMQQAFNCYGNTEQLIIRSPLSLKTVNPFNYVGTKGKPQNCATQHVSKTANLFFDSASSGVGIAGIFSHDPSSSAPNGYGDIDPNTNGEQDMPAISYGMSDAGLSSTDVGFYNNGNDDQGPNKACTVKEQGVCVVAPGETASPPTTYPNPAQNRGALIQFPASVDPVAFAYDPTYKKVESADGTTTTSYHFNIKFAHQDGSGGWRLDQAAYCTIFNGIAEGNPITNWNDLPPSDAKRWPVASGYGRSGHVLCPAADLGPWRQLGHDIDLHAPSCPCLRYARNQRSEQSVCRWRDDVADKPAGRNL